MCIIQTTKITSGGNMNKSKVILAATLLVVGSALFGADQTLTNLQNINNDVQATVQQGVGGWMKMAIGWLPVILAFSMGVGTLFYNMKKAEASQDNDYLKIGGWTFLFFFIGGVLGYAIDSMIGATLLGNATCGTEVFTNYWKESMGLIQRGSAQYNCL